MNNNTLKRFWDKVEKTENCWLWKASKRNKGYGAFVYPSINGDIVQGRAHRFSWQIHNGTIPKGICVLHKCDNPACVRPDHLYLGTKTDNNHDMCAKGRHRSGASKTPVYLCKYKKGREHHRYKTNGETIKKIRADRLAGVSFGSLVKKYMLSMGYLWRICNGIARKYD